MKEERYPGEKRREKKMQAKVVLARCPHTRSKSDNLFGMRIQKDGGDWVRTWAFKIDAERASHEGYDKERTSGAFNPTAEYPGCPYCHSLNLAQCACGKSFCYKSEFSQRTMRLTCPWCGHTGEYHLTERIDLQGGSF